MLIMSDLCVLQLYSLIGTINIQLPHYGIMLMIIWCVEYMLAGKYLNAILCFKEAG